MLRQLSSRTTAPHSEHSGGFHRRLVPTWQLEWPWGLEPRTSPPARTCSRRTGSSSWRGSTR
eukprot:5582923-Pyramimonas_sp.AAC.1